MTITELKDIKQSICDDSVWADFYKRKLLDSLTDLYEHQVETKDAKQ